MIQRLATIAAGSGELLQAEGDVLLSKAQRIGRWGLVLTAASTLVLIGLLGLLVAFAATLASVTGWVAALAITASVLFLTGLAVWSVAKMRMRRSLRQEAVPVEVRRRVREAKSRIIEGDDPAPATAEPPQRDIKDKAAHFVLEHPGITAGCALVAIGLLGPGRTLKLVGRSMMLASLATSVAHQAGETRSGETAVAAPRR